MTDDQLLIMVNNLQTQLLDLEALADPYVHWLSSSNQDRYHTDVGTAKSIIASLTKELSGT
jgi:hypothetical protein